MNPTFDAFLRSWPCEPWLVASLLVATAIYTRGWLIVRRRDRAPLAGGAAGVLSRRPVGPLSRARFTARSVRLAAAASPHAAAHAVDDCRAAARLARRAAGADAARLAAPRSRRYWIAPLLRSRVVRRACEMLVHPLVAWPLFVLATWLWHAPRAYDLALASNCVAPRRTRHVLRHRAACFGIPSSVPIPAGHAGRVGCCFRICCWPTCKTRCWPPGWPSPTRRFISTMPTARGSPACRRSTISGAPAC